MCMYKRGIAIKIQKAQVASAMLEQLTHMDRITQFQHGIEQVIPLLDLNLQAVTIF